MAVKSAKAPNTMTSAEVKKRLSDVPGFEEGLKQRATIMLLGEKIRQLRESELGISQTQAAELIGMEQPELSRIENGVGKRGPSYLTITRIINTYQAFLRQKNPATNLALNIGVSHGDSDDAAMFMLTDV